MAAPRHRLLGVEVFEDRVLPSFAGPYDVPGMNSPVFIGRPADSGRPIAAPSTHTPYSVDTNHAFRADPSPTGWEVVRIVLVPDTQRASTPQPMPAPTVPATLLALHPLLSIPGAESALVAYRADAGSAIRVEPPVAMSDARDPAPRVPITTPDGMEFYLPARFVQAFDYRAYLSPESAGSGATVRVATAIAEAVSTGPAALATAIIAPTAAAGGAPAFLPVGAAPGSADGAGDPDPLSIPSGPPAPQPERGPARTVTIEDLIPIDVDLPSGVPIAGLLGLESQEVGAAAQRLLDRVADLTPDLPEVVEVPTEYAWFAAAAFLTGGAGYALWTNRKARRPELGLLPTGWGEGHDGRLG
jgi:hypothetical protein